MHNTLINKLSSYLVENRPDVIVGLKANFSMTSYLEDKVQSVIPLIQQLLREEKPTYVIEEICMEALTKELRPSRFLYLRNLLKSDFPDTYQLYRELGVLTYETINLIEASKAVFDQWGFSEENELSPQIKAAIKMVLNDYLNR